MSADNLTPDDDLVAGDAGSPFVTPATVEVTPVVAATTEPTADTAPEADDTKTADEDVPDAGEPPADSDNESAFNFPARVPTGNTTQNYEVFEPMTETWNNEAITLALPPESSKRVELYVATMPNIDVADNTEGSEWVNTLKEGMRSGMMSDSLEDAANRPDATYAQVLQVGTKALKAARPRLKDDDGPSLKGARGVLRMNALMGRGSILQIPLWHSGFYITLKSPSEGRLLEMYQRMTEEKIVLGRATHGLAFANHSVFIVSAFMDLAMENLYETTVKDLADLNELRSMISVLDIPTIAWGLACAIWPRGFQYSRSVLDKDGRAIKVIKEKLNVGYLHWLDTASLDTWQGNHMAQRTTGSMSKQAIGIYRDHFTRGKPQSFKLNEFMNVTLAVPNTVQYLDSGTAWVNSIVNLIDSALGMQDNLAARNKHILDQGKATSMRQFAHWVQSFEVPELNKTIDDVETIAAMCDSLSSDDADRARFFEVIRDYTNSSTVSLIATPMVDETEKERTLPKFPWLLPMDPISSFFTLLDQKVQQIQVRP